MLDERFDLDFEVTGQEVIVEQDAILEGLMPALDLALGLGMHRSAAHIAHLPGLDIFRQFALDVTRAIIRQQPRLVQHRGAVAARDLESEVQGVGDVLGPHVGAQLRGDDVAREVVEDDRYIQPHPMILK